MATVLWTGIILLIGMIDEDKGHSVKAVVKIWFFGMAWALLYDTLMLLAQFR